MFGSSLRCVKCNQYTPDRCSCFNWFTGYEEGDVSKRVVFKQVSGDSPHYLGYYVVKGPWSTEEAARKSLVDDDCPAIKLH